MKKYKIFNRTIIGIKKGWNHPTLPENLLKLQLHPFIRIFRVLGGISILIILTKAYEKYNIFVLYISIILSILFFIYNTYLNYYRIKHIYSSIKKGDLDVKNSPLDKYASLYSKLLFCLKGSCEVAAGSGVALGIFTGIDSLFEHKGKDPIFMPFIADLILPDSQMERQFKDQKKLFRDLSKIDNFFNNLNDDKETVALFENSKLFTEDDVKIMKEGLKKQEQFLLDNKESLVAKIKDSLNKN